MKAMDLVFGDVVGDPLVDIAYVVSVCQHFKYKSLLLVVWWTKKDAYFSADALDPHQYVGELYKKDPYGLIALLDTMGTEYRNVMRGSLG